MLTKNIVNGIDVDGVKKAVDMLRSDTEAGFFSFRARNRWVNGAHCASTIQDFCVSGLMDTTRSKPFVMEADEPKVLMGEDYGPNATEALLHALASCLNATFMFNAAAHNVKIDELELDMEGQLDLRGFLGVSADVRNGFEHISVHFKVKSDAPMDQIKELCELAQKRSPVFDMVSHPTPVHVTAEKWSQESAEDVSTHI